MKNEERARKLANVKLFDAESKFYEKVHYEIFNKTEQKRIDETLRKLLTAVKEKSLCLDIGCGTGNIVKREVELFRDVVGLDISPGMLRELRQKNKEKNLHLICGDCEHLPFRSEIFDVISMYSVLGYLPHVRSFLTELYRVCKDFAYIDQQENKSPKAQFMRSIINLFASVGQRFVKKRSKFPKIVNCQNKYSSSAICNRTFSRNNLTKMLYEIGFSKVRTTTYGLSLLFSFLPFENLWVTIDTTLGSNKVGSDFGLYFTIIARKKN